MMQLSYDEAVSRIKEKSGLKEDEITSRIDAKLSQFSGLVSKEGAAYIIANELGIKLVEQVSGKLQIKNILVGMQSIEVVAKVLAVYPARQFNVNGRSGQVGSALVGDETGTLRAVFWNEQANRLAFLNKGDVIKLKGVYAKENRNSSVELHVNNRSLIVVNPPGEVVNVPEFKRENPRKRIGEIADSDRFVEVLGTIVQVFDLKFFEVCPDCGKRARPQDGMFVCETHNAVEPKYSYVLNAFLDDGTASVRTVFFRDSAQQLLKKSGEELLAFRSSPESFEQVKNDALGSFIRINARVSRNEMFGRIELVANSVEEAKPEDAAATSANNADNISGSESAAEETNINNGE